MWSTNKIFAFFTRSLPRSWRLKASTTCERTYRQQLAALHIRACGLRESGLGVAADYRAFAP
jgi:hypothetical protein